MTPAHRPHASFDEAFRRHLADGELRVARCASCGRVLSYAMRRCPGGHDDIEWVASDGKGVLVSWTVYHRQYAPERPVPYAVACVCLDEGPRLVAALDDDPATLRAGRRVRLGVVDGERVVATVDPGDAP